MRDVGKNMYKKMILILIALLLVISICEVFAEIYKIDLFPKDITTDQVKSVLLEVYKDKYYYPDDSDILENNKIQNPRVTSTYHYVYDFDDDKKNELLVITKKSASTFTLLVLEITDSAVTCSYTRDFETKKLYCGVFNDEPNKYYIGYVLYSSFDYEVSYTENGYVCNHIYDL
jgi:hypothetical protein